MPHNVVRPILHEAMINADTELEREEVLHRATTLYLDQRSKRNKEDPYRRERREAYILCASVEEQRSEDPC